MTRRSCFVISMRIVAPAFLGVATGALRTALRNRGTPIMSAVQRSAIPTLTLSG